MRDPTMAAMIIDHEGDQIDVARAFGRSDRSVRRYQRRFEDGGLAALGRPGGYPVGPSAHGPHADPAHQPAAR